MLQRLTHVAIEAVDADSVRLVPIDGPRPGLRVNHGLARHIRRICSHPDVADTHARTLETRAALTIGQGHRVLEHLHRHRLLVVDDELRDTRSRLSRGGPPIDRVVIPTRASAPAGVGDPLVDAVRTLLARDDAPAILVVVDGDGDGVRRRLASLSDPGTRLRIADVHDRRAFARRLAARVRGHVPDRVVEFALFDPLGIGFAVGALRNFAMLASIGHRVLMIDDDILPTARRPPSWEPSLRATAVGNPTELWSFADAEALERAQGEDAIDLLRLHGEMLGTDARALLAEVSSLPEVGPRFASKLAHHRPIVRWVQSGIAGDAGTASSFAVLSQRGASHQRLSRSADDHRAALSSRHVVRAAERPTLLDSDFFMAGVASLDLGYALPAFSPAGRNEDNLFGMTLATTTRDALGMCLPIASPHRPMEGGRDARARPTFVESRMNDLLRAATFAVADGLVPPSARALGTALAEHAHVTDDLCAWLQAQRRNVALATAAYLQRSLSDHDGAPEYWARDVEAFVASCERAATDHRVVAAELSARDPAQAAEDTAEFVRRYAELALAWPELRAAASIDVSVIETTIRPIGCPR
jgi:hypothetical protein